MTLFKRRFTNDVFGEDFPASENHLKFLNGQNWQKEMAWKKFHRFKKKLFENYFLRLHHFSSNLSHLNCADDWVHFNGFLISAFRTYTTITYDNRTIEVMYGLFI